MKWGHTGSLHCMVTGSVSKRDGSAVLLEVKEPEEFVGEVRRKWASR